MVNTRSSPLQRIVAALGVFACALGLLLVASPSAQAADLGTKKQQMQLLAAHEKLSMDVLNELADLHDSGVLALMARAEERDLQRVRRLLRIHGWEDLTKNDGPGVYRNFPLVEQTFYDMTYDGQGSQADGARVGMALQQMSLGLLYSMLDLNLTNRDRTQLTYSMGYAQSRMSTFQHIIQISG